MKRIIIPDHQPAEEEVERAAAGADIALDIFRVQKGETIDEEVWRRCDGIVAWHEAHIDPARIATLDSCRIIVRGGVGYDNIALEEAGARGIAVCNVPDYGTTEVADHAIGLMLALTRNLIGYWDDLRAEPEAHWAWHRGRSVRRLRDLVFGVVGLGRIGTAAARRAAAFDMDVVFYDPYLPDGHELGVGYRRALSLSQLLTEADVLSVHTPLTDETHNLIDADALHAMKPDAVLVNTARGGVVDPDAVLDALLEGRLGGAGLDVLPQEPLPSAHPLTKAWIEDHPALKGRLIVTPHAAFYSPQGLRFLRHKAVATAAEFLRTGVLRNCVNRQFLKAA